MTRTQIYLTAAEAQGVASVAAKTGRKRSEVIREAIDEYLDRLGAHDRLTRLSVGRGIWEGREDLDAREMREEFDRY